MTCKTCANRRGCIIPERERPQCLAWQEHLAIEGLGQEPEPESRKADQAFQADRDLLVEMHKQGILSDEQFADRLDTTAHRPKVRSFERLSRRARIRQVF